MANKLTGFLAAARKFEVAAVGLAATAVALGTVHGTALVVCNLVIGAAATLGVYAVPNATPAPKQPATSTAILDTSGLA